MIAATFVTAAAAATPVRWTTIKMNRALTALNYPAPAGARVTTVKCVGVGKPVRRAYSSFRCAVSYTVGGSVSTTSATVFAKPLAAGRVCGSTRSLAACTRLAAGPLPGDPRVCALNDPAACSMAAAKSAVKAKIGEGSISCTATSPLVYRCDWSNGSGTGSYTVTFVRGATGWATTVT